MMTMPVKNSIRIHTQTARAQKNTGADARISKRNLKDWQNIIASSEKNLKLSSTRQHLTVKYITF
jgi:hypothetical protein